jgi:hypothetical protein
MQKPWVAQSKHTLLQKPAPYATSHELPYRHACTDTHPANPPCHQSIAWCAWLPQIRSRRACIRQPGLRKKKGPQALYCCCCLPVLVSHGFVLPLA